LKPKETDFEPQTLGEHVRKRRLELGLTQTQAAERLGVNPWTILNWEKGHTEPPIKSMPAIIRFLSYDPFSEPKNIPERLLAKRRAMGWGQRELAEHLGVDRCTITAWELGGTILKHSHRSLVARFLGVAEADLTCEIGHRWNCSHEEL
jgi:transcriptional regulator with XRE-family HTH domain